MSTIIHGMFVAVHICPQTPQPSHLLFPEACILVGEEKQFSPQPS